MKLILGIIVFCFSCGLCAQSSICEEAEPFCAGDSPMVFPNTTGESGLGSVGCLSTTPNPSWIYIKINEPGDLSFEIAQSTDGFDENNNPMGTLLDVNFAIWGPYDDLNVCDAGNIPPLADIVDCSYSPDEIETAEILNAEFGEYYVVLITNFSDTSGSISLNQTGGTGSTVCNIVDRIEACEGDVVPLDATTDGAENYVWRYDDGTNIQEIANGDNPVLEAEESGTYLATPQDELGNTLVELEFNLILFPFTELNEPEALEECEIETGEGIANFNLQQANASIFADTNNASYTYYLTEEDALNGDTEDQLNANFTNTEPYNQSVFVRVETPTTCASVTELELNVFTFPELDTTDKTLFYCLENSPETVPVYALESGSDPTLYDFLWSTGSTDPFIEINTAGEYSVDISFADQDCFVTKTFIIEESEPVSNSEDIILCDTFQYTIENDDFPEASFTWLKNGEIIEDENTSSFTINTSPGDEFPVSDTYTLQVDLENGSCLITTDYNTTFNQSPNFNPIELISCFDFEQGFGIFNLQEAVPLLIDGISNLSENDIDISFYNTRNEALARRNEIQNPQNFENTDDLNRVFAQIQSFEVCQTLVEIDLFTFDFPNVDIENEILVYCLEDFPRSLTLNALEDQNEFDEYTYLWSTGETTSSILVNEEDTYSVEITNPDSGCSITKEFDIIESNIADFDHNIERYNNRNTLEIIIDTSSIGEYEFALNEPEDFQESNTFENLRPGIYKVYVRDVLGCGIAEKTIGILGIMEFFTPNGDGINDVWQISGLLENNEEDILLQVYDRYGKLMKAFTNTERGWDGTYNGKNLPTDDYWYKIRLTNGTVETGSFTLKR